MSILLLGSNSQPLTLALSSSSVFGSRHGAGTASTAATTALPTGGVAPYTYAWAYVSGDATFTANIPTGVSTGFSAALVTNQIKQAVWRCTVTDILSNTATADVALDLEEINFN